MKTWSAEYIHLQSVAFVRFVPFQTSMPQHIIEIKPCINCIAKQYLLLLLKVFKDRLVNNCSIQSISERNAYAVWEKLSSRIKVQQDVALEVF